MKNNLLTMTMLVIFLGPLNAQETMRDEMLKKRKEFSDRTMFQQFERSMVPTAEERQEKQKKIKARRAMLMAILDTTSQIKPELRSKLKRDVVEDPFSPRLRKFLEKHNLKEKLLAH